MIWPWGEGRRRGEIGGRGGEKEMGKGGRRERRSKREGREGNNSIIDRIQPIMLLTLGTKNGMVWLT